MDLQALGYVTVVRLKPQLTRPSCGAGECGVRVLLREIQSQVINGSASA